MKFRSDSWRKFSLLNSEFNIRIFIIIIFYYLFIYLFIDERLVRTNPARGQPNLDEKRRGEERREEHTSLSSQRPDQRRVGEKRGEERRRTRHCLLRGETQGEWRGGRRGEENIAESSKYPHFPSATRNHLRGPWSFLFFLSMG